MTGPSTSQPTVRVLSLGGTISMKPQPGGGVSPQIEAGDLVHLLPELAAVAQVEADAVRRLASVNLSFADVAEVARRIEASRREGIDGVVVSTGTDTLEETAFLLDLLVEPSQPVVVTCALRHAEALGADGRANLLVAVRVASSSLAAGLGVLVVANDEIHAARFVKKAHTHKVSAFASPTVGPVGWVTEDRVRILLRPRHNLPRLPWRGEPPHVPIVSVNFGCSPEPLRALGDGRTAGLVIAGAGAGQVPESFLPHLMGLLQRMPVVLSSKIGVGDTLTQTYGFPGGGRDLVHRGLISAGWLDAGRARVLLCMLLADRADNSRIRTVFDSVCG